jgi:hypothetical protein
LAVHRLDAAVVPSDVDDEPTGEAAAPEAQTARVALRSGAVRMTRASLSPQPR